MPYGLIGLLLVDVASWSGPRAEFGTSIGRKVQSCIEKHLGNTDSQDIECKGYI